MTEPLTVVVVEDHPAVRKGIEAVLTPGEGFAISVAGTARAGFDMVLRRRPDVAVVDLELPDESGLHLIGRLLAEEPDLKVIIYTGSIGPRTWAEAEAAGARGLVAKAGPLGDLPEAIRTVAAGGRFVDAQVGQLARGAAGQRDLTPREREVLRYLAAGMTSVQIADELFLSPETVKSHVQNAMLKLGADTRIQAVAIALEQGQISLD